jgi:hypothetical protein
MFFNFLRFICGTTLWVFLTLHSTIILSHDYDFRYSFYCRGKF